jgi:predicted acylesterase/phospholipase RssA
MTAEQGRSDSARRQSSTTKKIGLALSGGGFRASLYHLGLVRFLRDAGILPRVTHITSVSGGSILAAHLLLNWDRYNGSPNDFDAVAAEFLAFVRLDIRNRVLRRYPFAIPLRWARRLLGLSSRKLTRTGLLEYHYERCLYGDTSLFELPERPQLHILATNLSEGCLCSFTRNGLLMVRRKPGSRCHIDRIHIGLATVAMAVTASSAFPGFFPPVELTSADVGANAGEFGRQAYTDGGVFDNLGVRMFRCLERPLLADAPLAADDFVDFRATAEALRQAGKSADETPLRRLGQLMVAGASHLEPAPAINLLPSGKSLLPQLEVGSGDRESQMVSALWDLLCHYQLHREPLFGSLKPVDPGAAALLRASLHSGRNLDPEDQLWLNRHLFEAAVRQATGKPCFRRLNSGLDCVLVSDVGKPFEVISGQRAGGLIHTALRATDIVMDRVWQLEIETFHNAPGFVFAPVTEVVGPDDDPTAPHPEIQRQSANIRTDLDRFTPLEISSLVRHGYCVGRKACRARPDLFGTKLPADAPWDPVRRPRAAAAAASFPQRGPASKGEPAPATVEARTLQTSAVRRIWRTLLDYRDWVSYIYVPIIVPLLILTPYATFRIYQRTHKINQIVESLSQSSRDLEKMSELMDGPVAPFTGERPEEVRTLDEPETPGFKVLQDMHILDLRTWKPSPAEHSDPNSMLYSYRRLKVVKLVSNPGKDVFRLRMLANSPNTQIRFPPQQLPTSLRMANVERTTSGPKECRWEASYDFDSVPVGDYVDLIFDDLAPGQFLRRDEHSTTLSFAIHTETAEVTRWILLPKGKEYRNFRIIRFKTGAPDKVEDVKIVTEYMASDYTILAFKLLAVDGGYTYEVTWYYR